MLRCVAVCRHSLFFYMCRWPRGGEARASADMCVYMCTCVYVCACVYPCVCV